MRTLVALQPSFLPWRGYFDLIKKSDKFIFYDHVQYDKNGWRNRNRIIINNKIKWLTIPIIHQKLNKALHSVKIFNPEKSLEKVIKTIHFNYSNHPNFKNFFPLIEKILLKKHDNLNDLNIDLILIICDYLKIKIDHVRSSSFPNIDDKNLNLIEFCKKYNCDKYLSGKLGKNYINNSLFLNQKISVIWHDFQETKYQQLNNKTENFFENLSVIDYIFNKKK